MPLPYAVVVLEGVPEVTIAVGTGGVDFGALQKGESSTLSDSLVLTNTGDVIAKVEAKLIPSVGGVHGLVNVAMDEVIPAISVELGADLGNFSDVISGDQATLTNALILTNAGTVPAKVEAKFLSSHGEVHGLVIVDTSVIAASNFEVGTAAAKVPLADNGDVVDLGEANYVPSDGGVVSYDATLTAGEAELGIHTGIIEVIISAA